MLFEEVTTQGDRCVFKKGNQYYKVFIGEDKIIDFQRESFSGRIISEYHTNKNDHIVKTLNGQYNGETQVIDVLKQSKQCGPGIQKESDPIPLLITEDIGGEELSSWLQRQTGPIDKDLIRTFAFQLIWIIGEMHSQLGIQHNDIQEANIKVKEVTAPKTLTYKCKEDVFQIQLRPKDLEVFVIDFGSATLKKQKAYPSEKNQEPWESSYVSVLQINNCPEAFFEINEQSSARNSESDIFMIGHVLLSLHLHATYKNFRYQKFRGIHVFDMDVLYPLLKGAFRKPKLITELYDNFGAGDPLFRAFGSQTEDALEMFFINMIALNVGIQGKDVGLNPPSYVTSKKTNVIVKDFYSFVAGNTVLSNYCKTRFETIMGSCGDVSSQSLIRKIMAFEPVTRRGSFNYGLTGYLFHPYFKDFYLGYNLPAAAALNYIVPYFAPALEYASQKLVPESYSIIQKRVEDFEAVFNNDLQKQMDEFKTRKDTKLEEEKKKLAKEQAEASEAQKKKAEADAAAALAVQKAQEDAAKAAAEADAKKKAAAEEAAKKAQEEAVQKAAAAQAAADKAAREKAEAEAAQKALDAAKQAAEEAKKKAAATTAPQSAVNTALSKDDKDLILNFKKYVGILDTNAWKKEFGVTTNAQLIAQMRPIFKNAQATISSYSKRNNVPNDFYATFLNVNANYDDDDMFLEGKTFRVEAVQAMIGEFITLYSFIFRKTFSTDAVKQFYAGEPDGTTNYANWHNAKLKDFYDTIGLDGMTTAPASLPEEKGEASDEGSTQPGSIAPSPGPEVLNPTNLNVERSDYKDVATNLSKNLFNLLEKLRTNQKASVEQTNARTGTVAEYATVLHLIAENIYNIKEDERKMFVKPNSPAFYNDVIPKEGIQIINPKLKSIIWGNVDEKDVKNVELQKKDPYFVAGFKGGVYSVAQLHTRLIAHLYAMSWFLYKLKNPKATDEDANNARQKAAKFYQQLGKKAEDLKGKAGPLTGFYDEMTILLNK